MAEQMKTIVFNPKRANSARRLHIEAPGCIINITGNLHDVEGREVTRVDIQCDRNTGAGENLVTIPDMPTDDGKPCTYLGARVVRCLDGETPTGRQDTYAEMLEIITSLENDSNTIPAALWKRVEALKDRRP